MFKIIAISSITAAFLLIGCGGGGGDDTSTTETSLAPSFEGQFIDSYVQNVDYTCGDGSKSITDVNGTFKCTSLPISFSLGGLHLGSLQTQSLWPNDNLIFPQELLGLQRSDVNNSDVLAMAVFLQSCDEDKNTSNGIMIHDSIKSSYTDYMEFSSTSITTYADVVGVELITQDAAQAHLESNVHTASQNGGASNKSLPIAVTEAIESPLSTISDDTKKSLAFMEDEERLAYDVYTHLYTLWADQKVFNNIANNAEIFHVEAVKLTTQKYSLDTSTLTNADGSLYLDANTSVNKEENLSLIAGTYSLQAIQDLYDSLIAKGEISEQEALEVGCMIEVTDINDLDLRISQIQDENASDILVVFNYLRDGSYSHYWSFDGALKTYGVENGCCFLGDFYCKSTDEYPTNTNSKKGKH